MKSQMHAHRNWYGLYLLSQALKGAYKYFALNARRKTSTYQPSNTLLATSRYAKEYLELNPDLKLPYQTVAFKKPTVTVEANAQSLPLISLLPAPASLIGAFTLYQMGIWQGIRSTSARAANWFFSSQSNVGTQVRRAAYKTANAAGQNAFDFTGMSLKIGLALGTAGAIYYLGKKVFSRQATVSVVNNNHNNPTFHNHQNFHLHFPEGVNVKQSRQKDGIHFVIEHRKRAKSMVSTT